MSNIRTNETLNNGKRDGTLPKGNDRSRRNTPADEDDVMAQFIRQDDDEVDNEGEYPGQTQPHHSEVEDFLASHGEEVHHSSDHDQNNISNPNNSTSSTSSNSRLKLSLKLSNPGSASSASVNDNNTGNSRGNDSDEESAYSESEVDSDVSSGSSFEDEDMVNEAELSDEDDEEYEEEDDYEEGYRVRKGPGRPRKYPLSESASKSAYRKQASSYVNVRPLADTIPIMNMYRQMIASKHAAQQAQQEQSREGMSETVPGSATSLSGVAPAPSQTLLPAPSYASYYYGTSAPPQAGTSGEYTMQPQLMFKRPRGRPPKNPELIRQRSMLVSTAPPAGFFPGKQVQTPVQIAPHAPTTAPITPLLAACIPILAKAIQQQLETQKKQIAEEETKKQQEEQGSKEEVESPASTPVPSISQSAIDSVTPSEEAAIFGSPSAITQAQPSTTQPHQAVPPKRQPSLTPAQLQEITRTTIASLASPQLGPRIQPQPIQPHVNTAASDSHQQPILPKEGSNASIVDSGEDASRARQTLSSELKDNLSRLFTDPMCRTALINYVKAYQQAQVYNQSAAAQQQFVFRQYRPIGGDDEGAGISGKIRIPRKGVSLALRDYYNRGDTEDEEHAEVDSDEETIATRRPRRTPRKAVDYSKFFNEDEEDAEDEVKIDAPSKKASKSEIDSSRALLKKRRGRPPKHHHQIEDMEEVKTTPTVTKSKYYEGSDEEDEATLAAMQGSNSSLGDEGPAVEKLLSKRINPETNVEEYLVKWQGLSYLHLDWMPIDELQKIMTNPGTRLTRFNHKPLSAHHFDHEHIFDPRYVIPERIMYGWTHPDKDHPELMTRSLLVKWHGLPVDDATWEKEEDIKGCGEEGALVIAKWESQPSIKERFERALAINERPQLSANIQSTTLVPESPIYRHDHSLRPYQLEGLNWLLHCWLHRQSCIIADEMGLGKTVQSVVFLHHLRTVFHVPGPFLVIAPLSTLPHWQREFEGWSEQLRVIVYHGTAKARDLQYEHEFFYDDQEVAEVSSKLDLTAFTHSKHRPPCRFDVLLTTYEMALAGAEQLNHIVWRVAVFDEAHRLKNRASRAADTLAEFRIEHKLLLTGTPLQNNLEELWSLLNFLQPARFADEEAFRAEYGQLKRHEDVARLQDLLRPLMLRRLKEDVEQSIPCKEETIIEVELTTTQKRFYRAILERNFGFLLQGASSKNAPSLLNVMMELRKCCIHPFLINGAEEQIMAEKSIDSKYTEQKETSSSRGKKGDVNNTPSLTSAYVNAMIQASGKLVLLDKLLSKLRQGGHKVLIFSQMTKCLDMLAEYARFRGYSWERIDGAVKGADRQAAIDRFCDPHQDSFLFLLCTRAGGVGINLTAADTVIIYDSDWNPQNDLQAQARCHRIGQTKSVKVYRLLTRNTYEREMFDRAGLKLGLDKAILGQRMVSQHQPQDNDLLPLPTQSPSPGPTMDKKEVELLLKKGAYGLLMEDDEAAVKFCEESIDQILERRTTVIKHGIEDSDTGSNAIGKAPSSIFSKATFSAAMADYDQDRSQGLALADLDIDDPNFWERWAKTMDLDTSRMGMMGQGGAAGGMAMIDEPRIKRQLRKIRNEADKLGLSEIMQLYHSDDHKEVPSKALVFKEAPSSMFGLLKLLLRFGLSELTSTRAAAEHPALAALSRNDLIACARLLLRHCLDQACPPSLSFSATTPAAHDEAKFREDFEKLVIGRVDLDPAPDPHTLTPEEHVAPREFPRSELPFSNAPRSSILLYKSLIHELSNSSSSIAVLLDTHARTIVLRVQLYELIRQYILNIAGDDYKKLGKKPVTPKVQRRSTRQHHKDKDAAELDEEQPLPVIMRKIVDQLNPPQVTGTPPTESWSWRADAWLILGSVWYGLGNHEPILKEMNSMIQEEGQEQPLIDTATLSHAELDERLLKLLGSVERRSRATAKAALHTIHDVTRKRTPVLSNLQQILAKRKRRTAAEIAEDNRRKEEEKRQKKQLRSKKGGKSGKRRRLTDISSSDEDDDELDQDDVELRAAFSDEDETMDLDEEDFEFGSKKKTKKGAKGKALQKKRAKVDSVVNDDPAVWNPTERNEFMRIIGVFGLAPPLEKSLISEDDPIARFNSDQSPLKRDWSTFLTLVRDDPLRTTDWHVLDDYVHAFIDLCRRSVSDPSTPGHIHVDKARKALQRITQFARLRAWLYAAGDNQTPLLDSIDRLNMRKSSGMPKWWSTDGTHDLALLQGIIKHGLSRSDQIILDDSLAIHNDIKGLIADANLGDAKIVTATTTTSPGTKKRRHSTRHPEVLDPTTTAPQSRLLEVVGWPNELVLMRRVEQILDKLFSDKVSDETEEKPKKVTTKKKALAEVKKKKEKFDKVEEVAQQNDDDNEEESVHSHHPEADVSSSNSTSNSSSTTRITLKLRQAHGEESVTMEDEALNDVSVHEKD